MEDFQSATAIAAPGRGPFLLGYTGGRRVQFGERLSYAFQRDAGELLLGTLTTLLLAQSGSHRAAAPPRLVLIQFLRSQTVGLAPISGRRPRPDCDSCGFLPFPFDPPRQVRNHGCSWAIEFGRL